MQFGKAWLEQFPLSFDTRLIAQEGRLQVFRLSGGLSLEELHTHLRSFAPGGPPALQLERAGPLEGSLTAHGSAGKDALLTAEVFLYEMDLWLRNDTGLGDEDDTGRKRRRKEDAKVAALSSPTLLETHDVCRRFHNRLAIVGAAPGSLLLGPPSSGL